MTTLLAIIQAAAGRLAIPVPTAVMASTEAQVVQLLSLANKEGQMLASRADWQVLTKEQTFTTVAAEIQAGAVPSDYGHYLIDSMYNRTAVRKIVGPLTSAEWQAEKAFPVYTAMNPAFRIRGDDLLFTPNPTAGQTVAYEYVGINWILAVDGVTYKAAFTADTDEPILNTDAMTDGIVWRFKAAKGFDYSEEFSAYEEDVNRLIAQDGGGKPRLNLRTGIGRRAFWPANIPEGSWPSA